MSINILGSGCPVSDSLCVSGVKASYTCYLVKHSKTKRYKDCAVPYLQGLLNRDNLEKKQRLKRLINDCEIGSQSLRKRQRS